MSNWSHANPEKTAEIAELPLAQQNEAMRDAVGLRFSQRCGRCGIPYDKDMEDCCPECFAAKRYRKP